MADWYALDAVEEAIDDTKELLLPFDAGIWTRMFVIVFFAASGSGVSLATNAVQLPANFALDGSTQVGGQAFQSMTGAITASQMSLVAFIGFIFLVLLFLWSLISATMKFVFVSVLGEREVSVLDRWMVNRFRGLRLLLFDLGIFVFAVTLLFLLVGYPVLTGEMGIFWISIPFLFVAFVFIGLVGSLTDDFVIIRMLQSERGVIDSWQDMWPVFREEWKQVGMFLLVKIVLGIAISMVAGFAMLAIVVGALIIAAVLLIPFLVLQGVSEILAAVFGLFGVLVFVILLLVGMAAMQVPLSTFVRYFSIRVYEKLTGSTIVR